MSRSRRSASIYSNCAKSGLDRNGLTRPEIAGELYVSINTVNTHIRNIYSKLGARDRSSDVQHARALRLLSTGRR